MITGLLLITIIKLINQLQRFLKYHETESNIHDTINRWLLRHLTQNCPLRIS